MSEVQTGSEIINTVPRAFLFDVDGVITDPTEKKITTEGLGQAIAKRINLGEVVSLNTGRSLSWLFEHGAIEAIEAGVDDKTKLADFIAVGEKGGSWLTHENGQWVTHVDENIRVPERLGGTIRNLIESEFSDSMFYDESKLTMISIEMLDKHSIPDFTIKRKALVSRVEDILKRPQFKDLNLIIDPTRIATDIQNKHVGKHLGARRIVDWLAQKNIQPQHFIAIGDSQSDTEMAEELQDKYSTEFVFVGNQEELNRSKLTCPIIFTNKQYGEGTLEYLNSL